MASIEPRPSVLRSIRNQRLRWRVMLGEFIDNAFDASAGRISFSFDKTSLTIEDDGVGCSDVLRMLRMGDRENHANTQLGMYGIGAKDAAISIADGVTIISINKSIRRSVSCNWRELERSGTWNISDPIEAPDASPAGTKIRLDPLACTSKPVLATLIEELSLQYTPAIRMGKQITIQMGKGKPVLTVPEYRFPPLNHQVTADLEVDGKIARVTMGIIPDGHSVERSGLILSYGYRVIQQGQRLGLGDAPTPNLFGWIELSDGWQLTKNKDQVSSSLEALGEEISKACRTTIDLAASQATNVLFDEVAARVNDALNELRVESEEKNRKAKRKSPTAKNSPARATGTGSPHRQAARDQPGETFADRKGKLPPVKVAFQNAGADQGAFVVQDSVIYLNRDIPVVEAIQDDPEAIAIHAVYAFATWHASDHGPQLKLFETVEASTLHGRISAIAGMLLSRLRLQKRKVAT